MAVLIIIGVIIVLFIGLGFILNKKEEKQIKELEIRSAAGDAEAIQKLNEIKQKKEDAEKEKKIKKEKAEKEKELKKERDEIEARRRQGSGKRYIKAVGNLPYGAETEAFNIIENAIIQHFGKSDFKDDGGFTESNDHSFKVWGRRYTAPNGDNIRLTFIAGHLQDYTDLNGRIKNDDICGIEFELYFDISPDTTFSIGNKAEQEIMNYIESAGLPLRK